MGDPPASPESASPAPDAGARRWAELLAGWGLPPHIAAAAPATPWGHSPERFAVDPGDAATVSARWAREVLPPTAGTVLDIGCGAGRASLSLAPPATEVIGVDQSGAMLDAFVAEAARRGLARRTVHGAWPDVAELTPTADVAVCHHVVYGVAEIAPFLVAMTARARLAVVVELPSVHPMSGLAPAWQHFWGLARPDGPTHHDLLAVLRELGLDPEWTTSAREPRPGDTADPDVLAPAIRRRLCLAEDRDPEIAAWLRDHPIRWPDEMVTVRWAGVADGVG